MVLVPTQSWHTVFQGNIASESYSICILCERFEKAINMIYNVNTFLGRVDKFILILSSNFSTFARKVSCWTVYASYILKFAHYRYTLARWNMKVTVSVTAPDSPQKLYWLCNWRVWKVLHEVGFLTSEHTNKECPFKKVVSRFWYNIVDILLVGINIIWFSLSTFSGIDEGNLNHPYILKKSSRCFALKKNKVHGICLIHTKSVQLKKKNM